MVKNLSCSNLIKLQIATSCSLIFEKKHDLLFFAKNSTCNKGSPRYTVAWRQTIIIEIAYVSSLIYICFILYFNRNLNPSFSLLCLFCSMLQKYTKGLVSHATSHTFLYVYKEPRLMVSAVFSKTNNCKMLDHSKTLSQQKCLWYRIQESFPFCIIGKMLIIGESILNFMETVRFFSMRSDELKLKKKVYLINSLC